MKNKNTITEVPIRNGFLGWWDNFKYKFSLIRALVKSDHFYAIEVVPPNKNNGNFHYEVYMYNCSPYDVKNISIEIATKIQGLEDIEKQTNDLLGGITDAQRN